LNLEANPPSDPSRDYDVVLYGASGFVGRQTVEYMARQAPATLRWGLAGRDRQKLEATKLQRGAPPRVDVLVADTGNQTAVDAIVSRTRVLVSTAGPFALCGNPVVDACVRFKTDYVDITGEVSWVRSLIDRYQDQAVADGTRIVPFCGFDSVPSDLATFLVVRQLHRDSGVSCKEVKTYFQMRGGLNGGTAATFLNLSRPGHGKWEADPFLLGPARAHSPEEIESNRDMLQPRFDESIGAWIGPFVMAPVNTRVVRRSAELYAQWGEPYGSNFAYQEFAKYKGPLGWTQAWTMTGVLALLDAGLQQAPTRRILKALLPEPGAGPSERAMNEGWFRCEAVALGEDGRRARLVMKNQGDPGNRSTAKFVCEAALCLALDKEKLPGAHRGGVLTPATAFGDVLAQRLRAAGVSFSP
jgi:short subunit dehydrogenase-like uncharacterized protein